MVCFIAINTWRMWKHPSSKVSGTRHKLFAVRKLASSSALQFHHLSHRSINGQCKSSYCDVSFSLSLSWFKKKRQSCDKETWVWPWNRLFIGWQLFNEPAKDNPPFWNTVSPRLNKQKSLFIWSEMTDWHNKLRRKVFTEVSHSQLFCNHSYTFW